MECRAFLSAGIPFFYNMFLALLSHVAVILSINSFIGIAKLLTGMLT